ncbi:MAG: hypothetical protein NTW28_34725, partial [Candidatus Solibacter sp.]|nr:hypothetical protein [Candidatus Solibacter sp.]
MRILVCCAILLSGISASAAVPVTVRDNASPPERLGADRLRAALESAAQPGARVSVALSPEAFAPGVSEAFHLTTQGALWRVSGSDPSGVLYGCLELARRVRETGHLPPALDFADAPKFRLRGPNIGMQKTAITYDGAMYDYRYTPDEFG